MTSLKNTFKYDFDALVGELCVGDYVYVIDSVPVDGELIDKWIVKQLDTYWMQFIYNLGEKWCKPIALTPEIIGFFDEIEQLDDVGTRFRMLGTPFYIVSLYDGTYSIEISGAVGVSRVRYLHQLQNAYYMLTGVKLEKLTINTVVRWHEAHQR